MALLYPLPGYEGITEYDYLVWLEYDRGVLRSGGSKPLRQPISKNHHGKRRGTPLFGPAAGDGHNPISIVVADDHPAVLHGVAEVLTSNSDMIVVAACNDGACALRAIQQFAPTVAVLDIYMPGLSGLDVLARISAQHSATKTVFLTATACEGQLLTAISHGAKGIVLKDAPLNELIECVRAVAAGGQWLPSDLIDAAIEREIECQPVGQRVTQSLTSRERHITLMVAEGLSNKEIGRRLDLSEATVKIHLHNVYKKLGLNNRVALTAMTLVQQRADSVPWRHSTGAAGEDGRYTDIVSQCATERIRVRADHVPTCKNGNAIVIAAGVVEPS